MCGACAERARHTRRMGSSPTTAPGALRARVRVSDHSLAPNAFEGLAGDGAVIV